MRYLAALLLLAPPAWAEYADILIRVEGRTPRQVAAWFDQRGLGGWTQAADPLPEGWLGRVNTPPQPYTSQATLGPWTKLNATLWAAPCPSAPDALGVDRVVLVRATGTPAARQWAYQPAQSRVVIHPDGRDPNDYEVRAVWRAAGWITRVRLDLEDALRIKRAIKRGAEVPAWLTILGWRRPDLEEWRDTADGDDDLSVRPSAAEEEWDEPGEVLTRTLIGRVM